MLDSNVQVLGLRGNRFGAEGALLLVELLGKLTRLDISFNEIGSVGLEGICSALTPNRTLVYLDVQGNGIDEFGMEILAKTLVSVHIKEVIG